MTRCFGVYQFATVIRTLEPHQVEEIGKDAASYQRNGPRYKKGLKKIG